MVRQRRRTRITCGFQFIHRHMVSRGPLLLSIASSNASSFNSTLHLDHSPLPLSSPSPSPSRAAVATMAKALFADEPGWRARVQSMRPAICPFERVLPWIPANANVLDIGCGAGLVLGLLARSGRVAHAVGIDADANALQRALRMAKRVLPTRLEFRHTTSTVDWPTTLFDCVLLIDVVHHIAPRAQNSFALAAMDRVLPGGRFIYKDMASRPYMHALVNRAHDLLMARQWIHYIAPEHMIGLARSRGFVLTHREHVRRLWYAHDLLVFERAGG